VEVGQRQVAANSNGQVCWCQRESVVCTVDVHLIHKNSRCLRSVCVRKRSVDRCLVSSVTFPFIRIRFCKAITFSCRALPFRSAVSVALKERERKKLNSILFEWMNGNSKLTETENVIFYVSCGIL